jgi:hypothetical protein
MSPREVELSRLGGVNRWKSVAMESQSGTPSETNSRRMPAAARNVGILAIDLTRTSSRFEDMFEVSILCWTTRHVIARSLGRRGGLRHIKTNNLDSE